MKNVSKNEKGFTLVEISVSFLILVLIMGVSLSLLLFTSGVFRKSTIENSEKILGDQARQMIVEELIYATHLEVVSSRTAAHYDHIIEIVDGQLYFESPLGGKINVFGTDAYMGRTMTLSTEVLSPSILELKIQIMTNGKSEYETGSAIKILNLAVAKSQQSIHSLMPMMESPVISYDYLPYFIKGEDEANQDKPTPPPPPKNPPGTVADQKPKNPNDIKVLVEDLSCGPNPVPEKGACLFVKSDSGTIYKVMTPFHFIYTYMFDPERTPDMWKKISRTYDPYSVYEKGDIVQNNELYYQAQTDTQSGDIPGKLPNVWKEVIYINDKWVLKT